MPQTEATNRLRASVDHLTDTVERERQARRLSVRVIIVAVIVLVVVFAVAIAILRGQANEDRAVRDKARVTSCENYNEQQLRARKGDDDQNRTVVGGLLAGRTLTNEERAGLEAVYEADQERAEKSYPLRDCSPEGLDAYYANQ